MRQFISTSSMAIYKNWTLIWLMIFINYFYVGVSQDFDIDIYAGKGKPVVWSYGIGKSLTKTAHKPNTHEGSTFQNVSFESVPLTMVPSCSGWREKYCESKVGITRTSYPCELWMDQKKKNVPKNCLEVRKRGNNVSGIYEIRPFETSIMVLCDMDTEGGGWTHIQKRFDGSVDFYQNWREYKFGFGDLNGEFWLGLEHIYSMTGLEQYELLIEVAEDDTFKYAHYRKFRIGNQWNGYTLETVSDFSGTADDSLKYHEGMKFSTKDVDQDLSENENCAVTTKGAWWYDHCYRMNLNGLMVNVFVDSKDQYAMSYALRNVRKSRMLVRPNSQYWGK
ncbi:hypothetical protein JTB14_031170 [Gonioctena quinquepunctata]|nr:hypothetical protein JTB14_031170 [Gonioctena quinquepunctata]